MLEKKMSDGEWIISFFIGMMRESCFFYPHVALMGKKKEKKEKVWAACKYSKSEHCLSYFIIPVLLFQSSVILPRAFGNLFWDEVFHIFRWAMHCCAKLSHNDVSLLELSPLQKKMYSPVRTWAAKNGTVFFNGNQHKKPLGLIPTLI